MRKFRHLTRDMRSNISGLLKEGYSIRKIARNLGVAASTVSREIKRNCLIKDRQYCGFSCHNLLSHRLCACNGCPNRARCMFQKLYYDLDTASSLASKRKRSSNAGPSVSKKTFDAMDDKLYELVVQKGQSIENAWHACHDVLGAVSTLTLRRWIGKGYMKAKIANLRRAKRYRTSQKYDYSAMKKRLGWSRKPLRTMEDMRKFVEAHPNAKVLQTDSVEGLISDKKAILTILDKECHLQCGRIYSRDKASDNVYGLLKSYCTAMLAVMPKDTPLVIVTDNGTEFARISELEDVDGRIMVFFARPYCSTDKADCERNHELWRYVCPKGHTLDGLSQKDVTGIFDSVNSYQRESLEWKSPYDKAAEAYGAGFLSRVGITAVKPEDVMLRSIF